MLNAPVLFLIYNRPSPTARVFEAIRKAQPRYLFIAGDGAKNTEDAQKVAEARAIITKIDWNCEVKTLFRNENLGCGIAVRQAITWFFQSVESGIIIEDDCLVENSFFSYCETLLAHYAYQEQVMVVSAMSFQLYPQKKQDIAQSSYYFSNFSQIWGWATWRRAWEKLDFDMIGWDEFVRTEKIKQITPHRQAQRFWIQYLQSYKDKNPNLWATRWWFSVWQARGLTIAPYINLVSNIGFGSDGTNAKSAESWFANLPTHPIALPLKHPKSLKVWVEGDHFTYRAFFNPKEKCAFFLKNWLSQYLPLSLRLILKKTWKLSFSYFIGSSSKNKI